MLVVPLAFYDSCFEKHDRVICSELHPAFVLFPRSAFVMSTPSVINPEEIPVWTDGAKFHSQTQYGRLSSICAFFPSLKITK